MSQRTILIVPAWSDQAGQCRIVQADGIIEDALRSYRANPERWKEVGFMSSRGNLVCLDASAEITREIKECEPLYGGLLFHFYQ